MLARNFFLTLIAFSCSVGNAQLYENQQTRKQADEAQRHAEEQRKKAETDRQKNPSLEQKEAEALEYVGRSFLYQPNVDAYRRIRFYERVPSSSHSSEPKDIFTPLTTTSFVVTGVVMAPPQIYPAGQDEYLLEIKFPDGKVGYVNDVGCCGLRENLYQGKRDTYKEYVTEEVTDENSARRIASREKVALELKQSREKTERELRDAANKAAKAELARSKAKQQLAADEQRRARAGREARAEQLARPSPRLSMTRNQVISQTNWGAPKDINTTTTAAGVREQWVYGLRRYLYFDNGKLTAIQE